MPHVELRLELGAGDPERIEAACFAAGALAVTLSDAGDSPVLEPAPGATPLWEQVALAALFPHGVDRESVERALAAALAPAELQPDWAEVEDRAWEREWLKDFRPRRHGRRLWVCPHGQPPQDPEAVVVWLDPGLAFGTGTHATTGLCLEWLDGSPVAGRRVLDVGTGSGILAIAALALGARSALAIDIDAQALTAARDNADRNGVADRLTVQDATLSWGSGHELVLANILAEPLVALAPRMAASAAPGARVILSGILREQSELVAAAYRPWFDMCPGGARDGWAALVGHRMA
jgi:ribosomal protein L11 methyltransferase